MRNVLASLLLAWLASVNVGMSSPTLSSADSLSPSSSTGYSASGTISSKVRSISDYGQENEMVVPRLRHRLREEISSRLGARGILFDKMERPRRRRYSRRPPFFLGSPLRYERRYFGDFSPYYSPYGNYEMNPFDGGFPDEMDAFFAPPFSSPYYQSPEVNSRPSSPYYRPQPYDPPTMAASSQPPYYSNQFIGPQQMEPQQARPYYRGETPVSNRRRPQNTESSYQPEQVSPYYPSQAPLPNNQLSSPYYYNLPTPTPAGQENSRRPVQRQPARLGYRDESNVLASRPNTGARPVLSPGPRVNSEQFSQPTPQEQLPARPSHFNGPNVQPLALNGQGLPSQTSTSAGNGEQRAPTVSQQQQRRPDVQLPSGFNTEGRSELASAARGQPVQAASQRPSQPRPSYDRNEFNDQSPVLNAEKQSVSSPTMPGNHEQTADSGLQQRELIPDYYHVGSTYQNAHLPSAPIAEARPKLDQDARSRVLQRTWAQSDLHDEVQTEPTLGGNRNLDQSNPSQSNVVHPDEADGSKNGEAKLTAGPTPQKSTEEPQHVEPTQKIDSK